MMKKIKTRMIFLFAIFLLNGCAKKAPSEQQLLDDIPENFLTLSMDSEPILLEKDIEVEKRRSGDKKDETYATLTLANDDYEITADCYFQYNYYDQGGWILDICRIEELHQVRPLKGIPQETADALMDVFYADYSLEQGSMDYIDDKYVSSYIYEVAEEAKYCSYESCVKISYSLKENVMEEQSGQNIDITWEQQMKVEGDPWLEWDIIGSWQGELVTSSESDIFYMDVFSYDEGYIDIHMIKTNSQGGWKDEYAGVMEFYYDFDRPWDPTIVIEFETDARQSYQIQIHKDYINVQRFGGALLGGGRSVQASGEVYRVGENE